MAEEKKKTSLFCAAHAWASENRESVSLFYSADKHERGITVLAQACQPAIAVSYTWLWQ